MIKKAVFSAASAVVLALSVSSEVQAAALILNGGFETPVGATSNGNNIGTIPDNWTVSTSATDAQDVSLSNIANGIATGNGGTLLAPYEGSQALDGVGQTIVVYQDFTPTISSPYNIQIAFGGRDSDSATGAGSFYEIGTVAGTTFTPIAALTSTTFNPAPGGWTFSNTTPAYLFLANTTYRFAITLGNPDHVDAVLVAPVPEPTTLTAAGIGAALLGWVGIKRRRRH